MSSQKSATFKGIFILLVIMGTLVFLWQSRIGKKIKVGVGVEVEDEGTRITVTTVDEDLDANGQLQLANGTCTLVEAFRTASDLRNRAFDACPPGTRDKTDIIILQSNAVYTLTRPQANGGNSGLNNSGNTLVEGNGAVIERSANALTEFGLIYSVGNLTLNNLTLRGGRLSANGSRGGAIYYFGKLSLDDCRVTGNTAQGGGAIYSANADRAFASLAISNSIISGNSASDGGALLLNGNATVVSSQISGNTASVYGGGISHMGGLIYDFSNPQSPKPTNDRPQLEVSDSFILQNSAQQLGGGLFLAGQRRTINDQPQAWEVQTTIKGSTIFQNSAAGGGGIYNAGHLFINDSSIISNTASGIAGGISNTGFRGQNFASGAVLRLRNATVADNTASSLGGGILSNNIDSTQIENSTITQNSSTIDAYDGLYVGSHAVSLRNTILAGNGESDCMVNPNNPDASIESLGHNLFGHMENCRVVLGAGAAGDLSGVDAELGPLTGNGDNVAGNEHFPLGIDSLAINAGDSSACVNGPEPRDPQLERDQLGNERVSVCDIGAIEAFCGDGFSQAVLNEQCEDKNDSNADGCLNDCTQARCGDGILQAGVELCDDGNDNNDDECPATCRAPECGDGGVQADLGELCDDGNQNNNDACLNTCLPASCGDGLVQNGVEGCDDGNLITNDACGNNCVVARCGDALVQAGEECDDGNQAGDDFCANDCKIYVASAPPPPPPPPPAPLGSDVGDILSVGDAMAADPPLDLPDDLDGTNPVVASGDEEEATEDDSTVPSADSTDSDDGERKNGGGCNLIVGY